MNKQITAQKKTPCLVEHMREEAGWTRREKACPEKPPSWDGQDAKLRRAFMEEETAFGGGEHREERGTGPDNTGPYHPGPSSVETILFLSN